MDWILNFIATEQNEIIFLGIFILGGFIHGTLGFGFPLVATPLVSIFYDLRTVIIITLLPTLINNTINIIYGGKFYYLIKRFWLLALSGVIGSALGTWLIIYYPAEPLKLILAFTILVYLYNQRKNIKLEFLKENQLTIITVGLIGGFVGGIVNVSVVIFIIFLFSLNLNKNEIIKSLNICFVLGKLCQTIIFIFSDYITPELYFTIIKTSLACIPGIGLGFLLRKKINLELFKKIVNYLLLILTFFLIYQSFKSLII